MTTTERLIDSSKNRFARELLRSAELDEAPDNTVAKVALALGLGSTAVVTTVTSSAAAATGIASGIGTTTVAAAAPAVSAVSALGMLKVMAIVSLTCGTLSYGGVKLALKVTEQPAAVSTQAAARPAIASVAQPLQAPRAVASFAPEVAINVPAPPAADDSDWVAAARGQEQEQPGTTQAASPRETNSPNVGRQFNNSTTAQIVANSPRTSANVAAESPTSPLPPPRAAMPATASFPADDRSVGKGRSAPDLEREVAQLDHARAALVAGQPAIALREIDAYRVQNPKGMLVAESVVLRVRALLDMGFRSIAEHEAEPLLRTAPQSRHAERLRQILGVTSSTP